MQVKCNELADAVKIGIVILDKNFKIVDVNREILVKGNIKKEMLLNTPFISWFPEKMRGEIEKTLKDVWNGKVEWGKGSYELYPMGSDKPIMVDVRVKKLEDSLVVTIIDKSWLYKTLGKLNIVQSAVDNMAEGLVVTDVNGTIMFVNPGFTKMTGYSEEEAIGQNPRILKSGKQDRKFYENMWNTILSGRIWKGSLINKRKDGTLYWEEMTIVPVKDSKGRITNFVAVKRDVSERKKLEEEVRKKEEYYRKIFSMSNDGIFIETLDGKIVDLNEAAAKILGYKREELLGKNLSIIIPGDAKEKIVAMVKKLKREGYVRLEAFNKHKDGHLVPLELSISMLNIEGENLALVIARNLSFREEQETKYRILSEMASDAVILINENGIIEYWNPASERIFGYSYNEALNKPFWKLIIPEKYLPNSNFPKLFKKGFNKQLPYTRRFDIQAKRKDGKLIDVGLGISIFNISGKKYALAVIRDISERVEMERKLKKQTDELKSIYHFSLELGSIVDTRILSQKVYEEIKKLIDFDSFALGTIDWNKKTVKFDILTSRDKNLGPLEIDIAPKDSLTGWIIYSKKPLLIKNLDEEKDNLPAKLIKVGKMPKSWLGVPLMYKGEVLGILVVQSFKAYKYDENNRDFIMTLATQLAIVIKNAELFNEIKESKEKLENIINSSIVGVGITDLNNNLTFVNDTFADMLGYKKEELIEKSVFDLTTPEGKEIFKNMLERRKRGLKDQYEAVLIRKDGKIIHTLINASPLKDANGKIVGTLGIVLDITERKDMEEKIRNERERYKQLFESMASIVVLIQNERVVYVNKQFEAVTGYTSEDVLNKHFIEFVHPDMRDIVLNNYRRRMRGLEVPEHYIVKLIAKNGKEIWMDIRTSLINWEHGKADLVSMVDITEIKEMEDKLITLDEIARKLKMAKSKDEIYDIAIQNLYRVLNLYNSAILEIKDDILIVAKSRGYINTDIKLPVDGNKGITVWVARNNLPYYCANTDEDPLYIEGVRGAKSEYATPISIDDKVYGVLDVQKDEPYSISEDDMKLIDLLANNMAVALRSLEIQKDLEKAKNLQELMLHIVSHDLKNPLAVIEGYIDLMKEGFDPSYLDAMQMAVEEASSIIEKARLFSRLGAGKIDEEKELLDLKEEIENVASLLSHKYPAAKINIATDNIKIHAFPIIREVFTNIIDNAFKYGAKNVDISIIEKEDSVEIRIADDGPGIPEEMQNRIFNAFETLSKKKGSGLGLTIVKMIVDMHDGKVWVEENKPKGSVFVIQLPKD